MQKYILNNCPVSNGHDLYSNNAKTHVNFDGNMESDAPIENKCYESPQHHVFFKLNNSHQSLPTHDVSTK